MKYGYLRPHWPLPAIACLSLSLTACYLSDWKADYQSDVENGRNYTKTSLIDQAGNLLLGGSSTVTIDTDADGQDIVHFQPTLVKLDGAGAQQWVFKFDNGIRRSTAHLPSEQPITDYQGGAEIQQLATDSSGTIYAAAIIPGLNYATDSLDLDVALFSLSADGALLWQRVFTEPTQDTTLTLGISASGHLLLATHHYAPDVEYTSALALNPTDGSTVWRHDHTAGGSVSSPALYAGEYAMPAHRAHATTSATRIAISQQITYVGDSLYVYDDAGNLQWQQQPAAPLTATDVGTACSGEPSEINSIGGMAFVGEALILARSRRVYFCTDSVAWWSLERHNSTGETTWALDLPDPHNPVVNDDNIQAYEDWVNGNALSFTPYYIREAFSDVHIVINDTGIFLATTGASAYVSPQFASAYVMPVTLTSLVAAVSPNGELRWSKAIDHAPVMHSLADLDSVQSIWSTVAGLTLTTKGNPVLALNEQTTAGTTTYLRYLYQNTLLGVSNRLIEFDAASGKQDSFATEADYLARSVVANAKGVFKSGDNYSYLPAFQYFVSDGVADMPAYIHVSHYRKR